jgi:threonine dehydratase
LSSIPSPADVGRARNVLRPLLPVTRLVASAALSKRLGAPVSLKLESELPTGSFKPRGALYALAVRTRAGDVREVVASSTGNHGAAVAYAASVLGIPATIFLPLHANPVKRANIMAYGARIVETGEDLSAAARAAHDYAERNGAYFLDDATDATLPAGAATIAAEIFEQAPATAMLIVPIGDSALIRGVGAIARAQAPRVQLIGVQAERAPSYHLSWRAGRVVTTESCATIADGLATRTPVAANVAALRELVDDIVLVSDDEMLAAMRYLYREDAIVAEPAGAASAAAALRIGTLQAPTVLLVTGANARTGLLDDGAGVIPAR